MKRPGAFQFLLAAVAGAGALSLLTPTRHLGWVNDFAAVVRLPAVPITHVATQARVWLRGGSEAGVDDDRDIEHYRSEMHNYLALYNAERLRARSLQERIEQLERARIEGGDVLFEPVVAGIVGSNTHSGGAVFELNVGGSKIQPNAVAVYDGSHLVGRIAETGGLTSLLIPITNPAIGPLQAYVTPERAGDDRRVDDQAMTLLTPLPSGLLEGEVDRDAGVAVRDFVLLDDPTWPKTGRAMIIGRITAVEPIQQSPLRLRIRVQPTYDAANLSSVTIKVERSEPLAAVRGGSG